MGGERVEDQWRDLDPHFFKYPSNSRMLRGELHIFSALISGTLKLIFSSSNTFKFNIYFTTLSEPRKRNG